MRMGFLTGSRGGGLVGPTPLRGPRPGSPDQDPGLEELETVGAGLHL